MATPRVNYQTLAYLPNLNPDEELLASSVRRPTRYGVNPIYCTWGLPMFTGVEDNAAGSVQISRVALNCGKTFLQTLLEPDTLLRTNWKYLLFGNEAKPKRFELATASLIGLAVVLLTRDFSTMNANLLSRRSVPECFIPQSTVEPPNLTKPFLEARSAHLAVVKT